MATRSLHFDQSYREVVTLSDETEVLLRLVGPGDKARIEDGFRELSPEARYQRFHEPKQALTESELRYLTEMDDATRLAIGALSPIDEAEGTGIAVARFARVPDDPRTAEAAVVVIDRMQRKGLGRLLLLRLAAAARERGIDRFRCVVLGSNPSVWKLIDEAAPEVLLLRGDVASVLEVPLANLPDHTSPQPRPRSSLLRLFSLFARGMLTLVSLLGGQPPTPRSTDGATTGGARSANL